MGGVYPTTTATSGYTRQSTTLHMHKQSAVLHSKAITKDTTTTNTTTATATAIATNIISAIAGTATITTTSMSTSTNAPMY